MLLHMLLHQKCFGDNSGTIATYTMVLCCSHTHICRHTCTQTHTHTRTSTHTHTHTHFLHEFLPKTLHSLAGRAPAVQPGLCPAALRSPVPLPRSPLAPQPALLCRICSKSWGVSSSQLSPMSQGYIFTVSDYTHCNATILQLKHS